MSIEKIRKIIKKECSEWDWKFHVSLVIKYAKYLAKIEDEDQEIAEIAALLHDIGRFKFGGKDHNITGIPEAEKILKELNYPDETIEIIKHCVKTHRASTERTPDNKMEEIIRDADALSHFDIVPVLIQVGLKKYKNDIERAVEWVDSKLKRDWGNKMHLKESRKIAKPKYEASKLLIESTKKCF